MPRVRQGCRTDLDRLEARPTLQRPDAFPHFLLPALCAGAFAFADPPPGYYDAASGLSGPALKSALHDIIKTGYTTIPYDGLFGPLRAIFADPANASNILLFYSSVSVSKNASTWNREHLWPRSRGVSTDRKSVV